jgi:hypothetical protein
MNPQRNKKTSYEKYEIMRRGLICLLLLIMATASNGFADVVIGDWEDNNDGWVDWQGGSPISISDPTLSSRYSYSTTTGVTLHNYSLVVTGLTGWTQCLTIQLQNTGHISDFMANRVLLIDYSVAAGTVGGWNEIYTVSLNAESYGWHDLGSQPLQHFNFWNGSPARTATVAIDYSSTLASIPANPGWVEFIFALNSDSTNPHEFYFDNARFVTTVAHDPSPADAATNVNLTTFSWTAGYGATSHDVYFGTDFNEVNDANVNDSNVFKGNQTDTTYTPETLEGNTTYYWRIDENNASGTATGNVWSFTTGNVLPLTIKKCIVKAGKTQANDAYLGQDATDINHIKDVFAASGTIALPADLNSIQGLDINIISGDGNLIYAETIDDFNSARFVRGKYGYSHRITRTDPNGAIISLKMDSRKTPVPFAITAKNINLTGLACPVQLEFVIDGNLFWGGANEAIVNGKKLIPTRLMRLYQDTLVVTKAKVRHSTRASSDSLAVKGEIAVADMNLDSNEPNLATRQVVFSWGDANGTPQTFTIPVADPNNFKESKRGHVYKCSKVHPSESSAEPNALVSAAIDLDKCAFVIRIIKADNLFVGPTPARASFGISFDTETGTFNEARDVNVITGRPY